MRVNPEVGRQIADDRKSVRFEKRFYCPRDGRLVAGVVSFAGDRYLWIVGGRDEHAQSLVADLREQLADYRANEAMFRRSDIADRYDGLVAGLVEECERLEAEGFSNVETVAYRLADDLYASVAHAGQDPLPHFAPCPRCHRPTTLLVTPDGVVQI